MITIIIKTFLTRVICVVSLLRCDITRECLVWFILLKPCFYIHSFVYLLIIFFLFIHPFVRDVNTCVPWLASEVLKSSSESWVSTLTTWFPRMELRLSGLTQGLCPLSPPTSPVGVLFEWPLLIILDVLISALEASRSLIFILLHSVSLGDTDFFEIYILFFLFLRNVMKYFIFFASFSVMSESCRDLWSWGEFLLNHFRHFHYNMCMQFLSSFDSLYIINIPWRWVDVNTILR